MKLAGDKDSSKKKVSYQGKKKSKYFSIFTLKLMHRIFDSINISLLVFLFILSFLSFDSQRKWSNTYQILSKTSYKNNNLIDYISKTEEFYISKLESLKTLKKTTPGDLIYLERTKQKKEDFLERITVKIMLGLNNSKYLLSY